MLSIEPIALTELICTLLADAIVASATKIKLNTPVVDLLDVCPPPILIPNSPADLAVIS